jgi:hypothetical protein
MIHKYLGQQGRALLHYGPITNIGVGAGLAIAAGATAVGGVASSVIGSNAASSAAAAQEAAANNATATQYNEYQQQLALQQPWINAGQGALQWLQGPGATAPGAPTLQQYQTAAQANGGQTAPTYNPLNPQTFAQTPQSQYLQQQATQAAQNQASATGMQLSGAQLQQLQQNATGLASQDYNTAFTQNLQNYNTQLGAYQQNFQNANTSTGLANQVAQQNYGNLFQQQQFNINELQSLAGLGQTATDNAASAAGAYGNAAASNIIGAGNAAAAGTVGSANAITGGLNSALGGIGSGFTLNSILNNSNNLAYGATANQASSDAASYSSPSYALTDGSYSDGTGGGYGLSGNASALYQ